MKQKIEGVECEIEKLNEIRKKLKERAEELQGGMKKIGGKT